MLCDESLRHLKCLSEVLGVEYFDKVYRRDLGMRSGFGTQASFDDGIGKLARFVACLLF